MLDRLVVIDEAQIVESGSHRELLAIDGLYVALCRRQSDGFIGVDINQEAESALPADAWRVLSREEGEDENYGAGWRHEQGIDTDLLPADQSVG